MSTPTAELCAVVGPRRLRERCPYTMIYGKIKGQPCGLTSSHKGRHRALTTVVREGRGIPGTPVEGLAEWQLPEDGIVDLLAIDIVISGREVRLTSTEARLAAQRMTRIGMPPWKIHEALRINEKTYTRWMSEIGSGIPPHRPLEKRSYDSTAFARA